MAVEGDALEIGADDFARRFSMRGGSLMWFLGAGASAAAGVPTATDLIWEFKQQLFVSQRRVSRQSVADLSSPAIRAQLQAHIDALGTLPLAGAADEYAALFETVYPAESDRQTFLEAKLTGAKPSYGQFALATLMRANLTRLIWTTNFDPLVADACAKVFDTTASLTSVGLDATDLAEQRVQDERWPVEIKLHGDFRSRRLKNTGDELRQQDKRLRRLLAECGQRFGLVVAGYSGRDSSVMDAFDVVLQADRAFPAGLFWLRRSEDTVADRVKTLIAKAAARGIDAALVSIENFEEVMRDLVRISQNLDTQILEQFASERRHWTSAPMPVGARGWPVIRLNALPLVEIPTVCRRIVCGVGGYAEAQAALANAGVDAVVTRSKAGVLGFGADSALKAAFNQHSITDFDLYAIERKRLRYDSHERGLLRDALGRALRAARGLDVVRRRSANLMAPVDPRAPYWQPLKQVVSGPLSGIVPGHPELQWREGIETRLDWADDRLWLLVEPRTVFSGLDDGNKSIASDFARERTVRRYNRQLNELIAVWARLLAGDGKEMRALNVTAGVDASFRLSPDTAFSRRTGA